MKFDLDYHVEELLHGEATDWYSSLRDCIEQIKKLEKVAGWAKVAVDHYGFESNYQDPMHQIAAALEEL